jgi:RimJ/RimL family protein N-acetyltransferase
VVGYIGNLGDLHRRLERFQRIDREATMIDFKSLARAMEGVQINDLTFRAARPADGWMLFDATRNKSFNRYLSWSKPNDAYEVVARMEAIVEAHRRGDMCALSITKTDTDQWVGLFRFLRYRLDTEIVEISLWTHSDFYHASNGLGIVRTALDTLFLHTDVSVVLAASCQGNRSAQRILEICGFGLDGIVPRPHEDGHTLELFEFRLGRQSWAKLPSINAAEPASLLREARSLRRSRTAANGEIFQAVSSK